MKKIVFALIVSLLLCSPAHAVDIQEVTAPKSGVKAWLVEDHKLPVVALHLSFEGGVEQDPVDRQGLAVLTMNALTEGAGTYTATTFQHDLADHSISLSFEATRDMLDGELKCLSVDKQHAFDLLGLALTQPRFDAKDIERLRNRQLAGLRQLIADPSWQARYALFSEIFAGHSYGERRLGSAQTLKSITGADVKEFSTRHLARDNLIVAVAGDMTASELAAALDKIFGGLPAHAQLTPILEAAPPGDLPKILIKRDGTQTEMMFALPGPKRDAPDWYATEIANYILGGGGFSSRLMQDVRDKKGLTYGIETGLSPAEHSGLIVGQAAIDNPKMAEALTTIHDTMQKFHDDGVTSGEIMAAKDYLTGSQPLSLTSTDKIASIMVLMQHDRLGRDYLDRYASIIRSVTPDDIEQAIDHWFDPDKMALVMVGKPDGVAVAQIRDMLRQ